MSARPTSPCRRTSVLVLALLLSAALRPSARAAGDDPNAPSPAPTGDAVVAQGVAPMPAARVAWRVVQDTAEPRGQATFQQRALGFAVATKDAVLETDQATGARRRLAGGEASFVADGATVMRESLGAGPTPYLRLGLVPPDKAGDAGGDMLVFAGQGFPAPAGERDLDLVESTLYSLTRDDTYATDPAVPLLVVVLDGALTVQTGGGAPATLKASQAGAFAGAVRLHSLVANGAGTTYVAAVIGPAVPAASGAAPTVAPATGTGQAAAGGSISLSVRDCPLGMTAATLDRSACGPAPAGSFAVELLGGSQGTIRLTLDNAAVADGVYTWSGLSVGPAGGAAGANSFEVHERTLPPGYTTYVVVDGAQGGSPHPYFVVLTPEAPDATLTIYNLG